MILTARYHRGDQVFSVSRITVVVLHFG